MATPLKVLIVENSENDAILMLDCLKQAGYAVEWDRVQTADTMWASLMPPAPWDVILSDYSMPGFGGLAALKIYQQSGLDIPFILISGSVGEERAVEAMHSGVHDYIMKDRMQRLAPAVTRELGEAANRKQRREAQDENQRLNLELLHLNTALREKVELLSRNHSALEQLTWAASHDLREPLRMIATYAQLLLHKRPGVDPEEIEFCQYIRDGVDRSKALLEGLATYARHVRAPVDLASETEAEQAVQDASHVLRHAIDQCAAKITVDHLPPVRIRQAALCEIFEHLIRNALQYRRQGVPPRIHITSARRDDEVCFAVHDKGIGIKPEHQAQIFELFRRLHSGDHPGIGVGLPLSKRLIESYGGRFWLSSDPGVGSSFYFTLTAAKALSAAASS